jgi:TolB-like protein
MHSCIKDFEYDVFISYRQKDNRNNGWVTDFVVHLKKELEATFKESISVYFDENSEDGILEGQEVNETLRRKLKCLIFIPIVSQTYCDPSSYAWQHELLPFKKQASADEFGLKIRLENGNIASRIFPIRIHELDPVDTNLLAHELQGIIRPIDFIFKSPGVNRPLHSHEDHPAENQLKIYYRDQINKVANHIKDIITALKKEPNKSPQNISSGNNRATVFRTGRKRWLALVMASVVVASVFLFNTFFQREFSTSSEKTTIAVLPFKLIGNDEESVYLADGIQEAIRINLSRFSELKVKSRTSVERYRNIPKTISEITQELNVLYLLEGSAQKIGDQIRVVVQLVDVQADVIWSEKFDRKYEDLFVIQNQISESIARSLKATLTPEIAKEISKAPTDNFEAYDLFLKAQQASRMFSQTGDVMDLNQSIQLLKQSLNEDPDFALAYGWLAGLYMIKNSNRIPESKDSIVMLANQALALDSTVAEANLALSKLYFMDSEDVNALRYTYKALENESIDSLSVIELLVRLGSIYTRIGDTEQAIQLFDALLQLNPSDENLLHKKIIALAANHQEEELLNLHAHIKKYDAQSSLIDFIDLHLALEKENSSGIQEVYFRQKALTESNLFNQYSLIFAHALREGGKHDEAASLAAQFEDQYAGDPFYQAQIELYKGSSKIGLDLISKENVGHYNLSLSQLNPVFGPVANAPEFQSFLERNATRMLNLRERIQLMEKKGYLKRVSHLLETISSETEI